MGLVIENEALRVLVSLTSIDSDYQVSLGRAVEEVARNLHVKLEVLYADGDAITQSQQILKYVQTDALRPHAIIFEPVGTGLINVAKAAAAANIGWVVMNRQVDYLEDLQKRSQAPVFSIGNDHREIGRLQGRQLNALLPSGGDVLCIQGPASSEASQQRALGLQETIHPQLHLRNIRGRWTEESARESVDHWLRLSTSREMKIEAIAAQNDLMAIGARKAIEPLMHEDGQRWGRILFLGCDGLPTHGRSWVQSGILSATVTLPMVSQQALEMVVKALRTGVCPTQYTLLTPTPYPGIEALQKPRVGGAF